MLNPPDSSELLETKGPQSHYSSGSFNPSNALHASSRKTNRSDQPEGIVYDVVKLVKRHEIRTFNRNSFNALRSVKGFEPIEEGGVATVYRAQ